MRHLNALTSRLAIALGGLALTTFALTAGPPAPAEPAKDNLDVALQKHADQIIKYLREKKEYKNVGVLKFLVKEGDAPASDNVGPLNLSIANRLEVALVLANPDDEKLGIIERASAAVFAAKNPLASHLTSRGRAELFEVRKYALAWGSPKETVQADAFLTGTVEVSRDGCTLTVTVEAFDRKSKDPEKVCTFTAAADFGTLAGVGGSYQLIRRGPGNKSQMFVQANNRAQAVRTNPQLHPLEPGKSPIEVRVLYKDSLQPIKGGEVREPETNEPVSFELINRGNERYGVVLKVNGQNTLFREPYDALQCHRWVLEPGKQVKIVGFQTDTGQAEEFKVLSPKESEKDMVYYGEHAGTFSLVVFREAQAGNNAVPPVNNEVAAIARGSLPPNGEKPGSLRALKAKLRGKGGKAADGQKGIIVAGPPIKYQIDYVDFKPDPAPVLIATVRYRKPANNKVAK